MMRSAVGKLVRSDEILPLAELQQSDFYNDVLRPQDIDHSVMLPLAARDDFQVGLNICRSASSGPFEAEELDLLRRLYPHIRRSLLLGFRLEAYRNLRRAEYHVLD